MSSKSSSPFSSFSDRAEKTKIEPTYHTVVDGQVTVGELLRILQSIVQRNSDAKHMPVFHVEFGGLVPSTIVEEEGEKLVIAGR